MEKIKDKQHEVIVHISMEISQGISLCSYLNLKQANCQVFLFIFYLFPSTKSENRRVKQVHWGGSTSGRGEVGRRGDRRVNMVQKMCTHTCKCKNNTC
jgi:hypothetical protein